MRLHQLHRRTLLPVSPDEAFPFFCDPHNLQRITPPELDFRITEAPRGELGEGVEIGYRLKLWGVPFTWRSRLHDWQPGREFVDSAMASPYRVWHHRHVLVPHEAGTAMYDLVDYALPFGPIGALAHFAVRRQLERIFDYREKTIQRLFTPWRTLDPVERAHARAA